MSAPTELKAEPRRFRFRVRTGIVAIALVGLVLALLDVWLRAPYRAERRAAVALTRFGGKVVMVDKAPRWLRQYVSDKLLDMSVAASIDLSHSRVKDADLVHLRAFQHFGTLNLSDTEVGNAGLEHLRTVIGYRFIDLSRTRVTDTSALFGGASYRGHASGVKLSGNRIAGGRLFPFEKQWCPLQELDLSRTDADDRTLTSLPDGLVNLAKLDLSGTAVTDAGLGSLARLEGLATLDLRDTRVTPAGVARLKAGWRGWRPLTILSGRLKGPPGIIIWGSTAPKPPQPEKRPKSGVRPTAPEA